MEPILLTLRVRKELGAPAVSSRQVKDSAGRRPWLSRGCFSTRSCRAPQSGSCGLRWPPSLLSSGGGFLFLEGGRVDAKGTKPEPDPGEKRKEGSYRHPRVHPRRHQPCRPVSADHGKGQ